MKATSTNKKEVTCIGDYTIIKRVGFGACGLVYKVYNNNDPKKQTYILKQIPYSEINPDDTCNDTCKNVKEAKNEAVILSKLSCKYIVKYYESFIDEDNNLNIIMEYCDNGDLNSFIQNLKKQKHFLSENDIWFFFIQISLGLAYIHSKNILHRDLKPLNIFLTSGNEIKIGDLGVAKILQTNANAVSCIGTPSYLAPEICQEKPYNSKCDVWALGCILYELCTFNKPFMASNPAALILKIINGKYNPISSVNQGVSYSKDLQDLVDKLLLKDYQKRPLMKDIIEMDIFQKKAKSLGFDDNLNKIKKLFSNESNFFQKFQNKNNNNNNMNNNNNNIRNNNNNSNISNNNNNFNSSYNSQTQIQNKPKNQNYQNLSELSKTGQPLSFTKNTRYIQKQNINNNNFINKNLKPYSSSHGNINLNSNINNNNNKNNNNENYRNNNNNKSRSPKNLLKENNSKMSQNQNKNLLLQQRQALIKNINTSNIKSTINSCHDYERNNFLILSKKEKN